MPTLDLTPDELLTTTRTVRKRLDLTRPVPMELVRECLEIALQAPSGSNRQGWEWVVVTDQDRRRAIGELYRRAVEEYLTSRWSADKLFGDDPERSQVQQRVGSSVAWLGEHMADVPVLLLPCLHAGRRLADGNQAGLWGRCSRPSGATCWPLAPRPGHGMDDFAPELRGRGRIDPRSARRRTAVSAGAHCLLHR